MGQKVGAVEGIMGKHAMNYLIAYDLWIHPFFKGMERGGGALAPAAHSLIFSENNSLYTISESLRGTGGCGGLLGDQVYRVRPFIMPEHVCNSTN